MNASPLSELQSTLNRIRPVDQSVMAAVQSRLDRQTKPTGSLGRLEEFARQYVAITGREELRRKAIFTFIACIVSMQSWTMRGAVGRSAKDWA